MAQPLKDLYSPLFFERLCKVLEICIPAFPKREFVHKVFTPDWADLELKQRTRRVTECLHCFLPNDFSKAVVQVVKIAKYYQTNKVEEYTFPLIFLPDYVELYGQNHFTESMRALEYITPLISAEFAIRSFIVRYPKKTLAQIKKWTKHENHHVRRLASEGCRPRLPWAMALPKFIEDPTPILPVLEALKKDNSEYVRKSVANNLNDISKDHPDIVLQIVKRWKGLSKETDWILKHASRTLLKRGEANALALHGFDPNVKSAVSKLSLEKKNIKIGESTTFSFCVTNRQRKEVKLRIEYAITYLTSTGKSSRKIFQVSETSFASGQQIQFKRKQRFTDFTTRKHFPGKHKLEIIVNGKIKSSLLFTLMR